MKLFCSILAIMILALSCIPCSDAVSYAREHQHSTAADQEHSGADAGHQDLCSPFCQCACCTIAFGLPARNVSAMLGYTPSESKVFTAYVHKNLRHTSLPVWQPPQRA